MQNDDLKIYVSVVEGGSFAAAARQLGLTRSAVSRRIDGLERRLGVRLLDRTTKHLNLTDAGDVYFRRGVKILSDIQDAELAASQYGAEPRGTLKITCAVMIGLYNVIPHIAEFMEAHPDLSVSIDLSDAQDDPNLEIHDVAITWGKLPDSALLARKIGETRQIICAAPSYLEKHDPPEVPSDLLNHTCIVIRGFGAVYNDWFFESERGVDVVKVTGPLVVNSGNAAYQALLAGCGIGRLTDLRGRIEVRDGSLVELLSGHALKDAVPIYALYRGGRSVPPKVRALVDFLKAKLSSNIAIPL